MSAGIQALTEQIHNLDFQYNIESSLDAKVQNAKDALSASNAGQHQDVINKLQAAINEINARRGKSLTDADVDELTARIVRIIAAI